MIPSADLASTRQARVASLNATQPNNNKSESTKAFSNKQSADPRTVNTLSPRQSDAILNLASRDGSEASINPSKSQTLNIPSAHRSYQDTFRSALYEDDDGEVNLPGISVGPGGSTDGDGSAPVAPSDGGGGGTAPVEGGGGGSPPPVENGGGTAPPESGTITPVQGSSPGSSTTGTVTIAEDVRVEQSAKTEAGFLLNWEDQKDTRVGTSDNGALPLVGDKTAQRLNPSLLITGQGAYVHSGGKILWVSPTADHYLSISYQDGNLNISSASTRAL